MFQHSPLDDALLNQLALKMTTLAKEDVGLPTEIKDKQQANKTATYVLFSISVSSLVFENISMLCFGFN